jgi:PAS domain S-box-containing protein
MMQFHYTPYILPLLASAVIAGAVAIYAWRRRSTPSAVALSLLALAIMEWLLGYALEIAGADVPTKIFWGKIQYIGIVATPLLWLIFAVHYANRGTWLSRRNLFLLAIIPLITVALVFTNEAHSLIWKEIQVYEAADFSVLDVSYGLWFWVHSVYSYLLLAAGTLLILRAVGRRQGVYRGQTIALIVAVATPWIANALYLLDRVPIPHLDPTPFAFTISVVALTWGIFRYRLIDLSPVARDLVVEEMNDGMIVLDAQARIADINPAAQRMINLSASQAVGQAIADVLNPWPQIVERFRGVLEAEAEIAVGEGNDRRWYEIRLSPLYDQRHRSIGRVITVQNITERMQAQELKQSFLDDMQALQEIHLTLSEIKDLETLYVKMIEQAQRRLGLDRVALFLLDDTAGQLSGTYGVDRNGQVRDEHDYHEPITSSHWTLDALQAYNHTKLWEDTQLYDDGSVVGTGWKAVAALWNGQQAIGYLVCDNYLTHKAARPYEAELISLLGTTFGHLIEGKRAEEQIRQLSRAVEASPTSIVITDTQGRIQYVNPKFTEVTGYTFAEAVGQNPRILKTDRTPPEVHRQMWETLLAGREWHGEFCNRKKNGEFYWELASISPITDAAGNIAFYVAVKEDITERKRVQEELARAHDQALEASHYKSELIAKVSHELRTPLSAILGYAEFLYKETFAPLTPQQKHFTAEILDSVKYLNSLINDLLDVSQIERGTVKIQIAPFEVRKMVDQVGEALSPLAKTRGLRFTTEVAPDLPAALPGDQRRVRQILTNLVNNAIKFTEKGSVAVHIRLADQQHWVMQVTDTGPGISTEAQARIFESFWQADGSSTRKQRGYGLGLSIVKQLTELMGGEVTLDSTLGRGSTFKVMLPLEAPTGDAISLSQSRIESSI